jgi:hypothetical protein
MQVVRDTNKRQEEEHVAVACVAVLPQHMQHLGCILVTGYDAAVRAFAEKVKKAVGCVAVVAGEWEEGELAVPGRGDSLISTR